jgi:hypothetical protein
MDANFLKTMPSAAAGLRRTPTSLRGDDYSTSRKLRQAGLGLLDLQQPRILTARLISLRCTATGKTLETNDHLALTRVPTLVYKPHRAFSFQAIPKIAIAHSGTGATKNPGISLGRSCE